VEAVPSPLYSENKNKGGSDMKEFIEKLKLWIAGVEKDLPADSAGNKFTEVDIQAAEKRGKDAMFAEVEKERKEKEEAQRKLKGIEDKKRKDEVSLFCETMCKEGKLTPALRKTIEPAMIVAAGDETVIEFAEASGTIKKTKLDCLKDFIKALPKLITFSEIAGDDKTRVVPKDFDTAVQAVMTEKKLSKAKAISFCAKEYPELHQEYVTNFKTK
jgi:hypothetical protein